MCVGSRGWGLLDVAMPTSRFRPTDWCGTGQRTGSGWMEERQRVAEGIVERDLSWRKRVSSEQSREFGVYMGDQMRNLRVLLFFLRPLISDKGRRGRRSNTGKKRSGLLRAAGGFFGFTVALWNHQEGPAETFASKDGSPAMGSGDASECETGLDGRL